jgi:hypothetical protein
MHLRTALLALGISTLTACAAAPAAAPPAVLVPAPAAAPIEAAPTPTSSAADKVFAPQPDLVTDDASLPAGTVRVTVVDADGEPIPRAPITLESVLVPQMAASLDVLVEDSAIADDRGVAVFRKRRMDEGVRQVASTRRGSGTFSVTPFKLDPRVGKRVLLHAYETVTALENARVGAQVATYLTLRADKIEVQVLYSFFNLARTAWVPTHVRVAFPPLVSGFFAHDLGDALRVDDITAAGFSLVGVVSPGKSELDYVYEVPRAPGGPQTLTLEMPPRTAIARVILDAAGKPALAVAGFAAATPTEHQGRTLLMADRQMSAAEGALKMLEITLSGDPR